MAVGGVGRGVEVERDCSDLRGRRGRRTWLVQREKGTQCGWLVTTDEVGDSGDLRKRVGDSGFGQRRVFISEALFVDYVRVLVLLICDTLILCPDANTR